MLMIRMMFAVAATLLAVSSGAQAAECFYGPTATYVNRTAELHMTARSGQACTISYFGTTERYQIHGAYVVTRPRNGTASTQGHVLTYKARAGFKGRDQFVYSLRGSYPGRRIPMFESRLNVTVTVD